MEVEDAMDQAQEAIQVGLRAIKHAARIALKVCAKIELAQQDKARSSQSFDVTISWGSLMRPPNKQSALVINKS